MKKSVSLLCCCFIGLLVVVPSVRLLAMGITGFTDAFMSPNMGRILLNTLTISILSLLVGGMYLFAAYRAIGAFENTKIRSLLVLVFSLPAIIPVSAYALTLIKWLPIETLTQSSFLLQIIAAAEAGLRFSAAFVIGALFMKRNSRKAAVRPVLWFAGIWLLKIFMTDRTFLNDFSNPLTYEHLDTYSTASYRSGMMQGDFTGYAVRYVTGLLLQLLPAVAGCLLLAALSRKRLQTDNSSQQERIWTVWAAVPAALLMGILITCGKGNPGLTQEMVGKSYMNGVILASITSLIVVGLGLLLAVAAGKMDIWGICIVSAVYFLSDDLLGPYLIVKDMGLMNTFPGVVLQSLHWIVPVAFIGMMILKEQFSVQKLMAAGAAGFGIAFAWFWGDSAAPNVVLNRREAYPVSVLIRQMSSAASAEQVSLLLYILIPMIVAGAGIICGGILYQREKGSHHDIGA